MPTRVPSALSTGDFDAHGRQRPTSTWPGLDRRTRRRQVLVIEPESDSRRSGDGDARRTAPGNPSTSKSAGLLKASLDTYSPAASSTKRRSTASSETPRDRRVHRRPRRVRRPTSRTRSRRSPTFDPTSPCTEGNALGRIIGSVFDFMINAVNGLLLMSVDRRPDRNRQHAVAVGHRTTARTRPAPRRRDGRQTGAAHGPTRIGR